MARTSATAAAGHIVAELGRPETADETAARKAESSRVYRSSQTVRNLVAALLATLAVVAVVIMIVPRGNSTPPPPVDVAAIAQQASTATGQTVVVPHVPTGWRANDAALSGDATSTWTVVYATGTDAGFLRVAQGFGADTAWDARLLSGAAPSGTVTIDGIEWTRYAIGDPSQNANISYAIGTSAGPDRILVYGATDAKTAATAARGLTDQIAALRQEKK
ncbi:DUF4245 family protein [Microbacterium terrisoli]|uniref:DUF4245 family protein n=1 Tax=Microbacterium terrisoli TaxID=3242192 RepID=UPI002805D9B8|nr:DUF4245 family protein [Microbacterium protaetiae]